MYVEGLIDKDYFDILVLQGHEPDWVCTTVKEASKKGYDFFYMDDENEKIAHNQVLVRIWVDMDMETFFPPEDIVRDKPDLLPLMVMNPNKILKDFAEKKLKGE